MRRLGVSTRDLVLAYCYRVTRYWKQARLQCEVPSQRARTNLRENFQVGREERKLPLNPHLAWTTEAEQVVERLHWMTAS